jgi:hypothetical protein
MKAPGRGLGVSVRMKSSQFTQPIAWIIRTGQKQIASREQREETQENLEDIRKLPTILRVTGTGRAHV